jgi:hypothetical protein
MGRVCPKARDKKVAPSVQHNCSQHESPGPAGLPRDQEEEEEEEEKF